MANEPERPIEKLLRDAAKKRSEEAGGSFDLHPATRRLLQGEVARKFARETPKASSLMESISRLWPRIAWCAAILAVMAVVVWMIIPRPGVADREVALSQNEVAKEPFAKSTPAPVPAPLPAAAPAESPPTTTTAVGVDKPVPAKSDAAMGERDKDIGQYKNKNEPLQAVPPPAAAMPEVAKSEKKLQVPEASRFASQEAEKMKTPATDRIAAKESAAAAASPSPSYYSLDSRAPEVARAPASAPSLAPTMPAGTSGAAKPVVTADGSLKQAEANTYAFNRQSAPRAGSTLSGAAVATDEVNGAPRPSTNVLADHLVSQGQKSTRTELAMDSLAEEKELRVTEGFAKGAPSPPVLASFRVDQRGGELRIIDADGSIYSGYIQPSTAATRRRLAGGPAPGASTWALSPSDVSDGVAQNAQAPGLPGLQVRQDYTFRVTGRNLTLRKNVVFAGNLATVTNLNLFKTGSNAFGDFKAVGGALPQQQPPAGLRIAGRLSIGGGKEVEINAAPANP